MIRYFIEVCYKGTGLAGFQIQKNANTVQGVLERAMEVYFRKEVKLTGSSRTDAGVHARQNYFHTDLDSEIDEGCMYNLNALLPLQVAVKSIRRVEEKSNCRFDALWREYSYKIYSKKDPFIDDVAYYYPFRVDVDVMKAAAEAIKEYSHFEAFSKRNTQVKTFRCVIMESSWRVDGDMKEYRVRANRYLRGMVRGLVGTMLQVGRGKMSVEEFRKVIKDGEQRRVNFSVPGHGLCLDRVEYADGYFS